jgi:hypothetical protein
MWMGTHIYRSIKEPLRKDPTPDERWRGPDKGLVFCWENGRKLAEEQAKLARRAKKGELPMLSWKGGVKRNPKKNKKNGSLCYLAQLQGLRGEDLDIHLSSTYNLTCARTGVKVTYSVETTVFEVA